MTRWAADLGRYQREFREQAAQIAAWDRMLVENGEKITKLYLGTYEAEKASKEIERQLSAVESQQAELDEWLTRYEAEVDELWARQMVGPGGVGVVGAADGLAGPDQERERTYKLAEKLTEKLDDMNKDLRSMINEINDATAALSKGSKADDPVSLSLLRSSHFESSPF